MAREEFLLRLRVASRLISPERRANGIRLEPGHVAELLRSGTIWLTPGTVEAFDANDFPELSVEDREELSRSVAKFREIASRVAKHGPATPEQIRDGLSVFQEILSRMQPYMEEYRIYPILRGRLRALPDYVRDFAVRVDQDSTGDPAAYIWIIVSDDVTGKQFASDLTQIRHEVQSGLRAARIDRYPYIMVRTEAEQRILEREEIDGIA